MVYSLTVELVWGYSTISAGSGSSRGGGGSVGKAPIISCWGDERGGSAKCQGYGMLVTEVSIIRLKINRIIVS